MAEWSSAWSLIPIVFPWWQPDVQIPFAPKAKAVRGFSLTRWSWLGISGISFVLLTFNWRDWTALCPQGYNLVQRHFHLFSISLGSHWLAHNASFLCFFSNPLVTADVTIFYGSVCHRRCLSASNLPLIHTIRRLKSCIARKVAKIPELPYAGAIPGGIVFTHERL